MMKQTSLKRFIKSSKRISCSITVCLFLSACSQDHDPFSESRINLSPRLISLFEQTCANCHTRPETSAPQVGDHKTWQQILAKGMTKTLERTLNGYGGMPPGGQCFECSPEDLEQLILFMRQTPADVQSTIRSGTES